MVRLLIGSRRDVIRLAVLVVLGLTLPLVTGMSSAAGSPAPASISIAPKAYVYNSGLRLEAQVTIQCTGGIADHEIRQLTCAVFRQTACAINTGQLARFFFGVCLEFFLFQIDLVLEEFTL